MQKTTDESITKKKDNTFSKHYTILINGTKHKILNYKIKPVQNNSSFKILELLSKYKFDANLNTDKLISVVIDNGEKLNIEGNFAFATNEIRHYRLGITFKS